MIWTFLHYCRKAQSPYFLRRKSNVQIDMKEKSNNEKIRLVQRIFPCCLKQCDHLQWPCIQGGHDPTQQSEVILFSMIHADLQWQDGKPTSYKLAWVNWDEEKKMVLLWAQGYKVISNWSNALYKVYCNYNHKSRPEGTRFRTSPYNSLWDIIRSPSLSPSIICFLYSGEHGDYPKGLWTQDRGHTTGRVQLH